MKNIYNKLYNRIPHTTCKVKQLWENAFRINYHDDHDSESRIVQSYFAQIVNDKIKLTYEVPAGENAWIEKEEVLN